MRVSVLIAVAAICAFAHTQDSCRLDRDFAASFVSSDPLHRQLQSFVLCNDKAEICRVLNNATDSFKEETFVRTPALRKFFDTMCFIFAIRPELYSSAKPGESELKAALVKDKVQNVFDILTAHPHLAKRCMYMTKCQPIFYSAGFAGVKMLKMLVQEFDIDVGVRVGDCPEVSWRDEE